MKSKCKYIRLGDYIEQRTERNSMCLYGSESAIGVNIDKEIRVMRGSIEEKDFAKFYLVHPGDFAYNPRGSRKLGLGYNDTDKTYIITFNNVVFHLKKSAVNIILPEYLFMYLSRKEWDREAEYMSWGSSTEVFEWAMLCETLIPLPSIEEQTRIVAVWKGLRNIQQQNIALAEPLMQLCQSYLQECKHKYSLVEIEPSIVLKEEKKNTNKALPVVGINIEKRFMPTNANMEGIDIRKYKIICKNRFVFSGMQTGRDMSIRIGIYTDEKPALISPAYTTFEIDESKGFLSEYVALYFLRSEMDRYGAFLSDSSVRANLDWDRFVHIAIPQPPIDVQKAIVNLYICAQEAQNIARQAAEQANEICPALIQKVVNQ